MRIRLPHHSTTHIHAEALYHWHSERNGRLVSLRDWQRALADDEGQRGDSEEATADLCVEGEVDVGGVALASANASPKDASPKASAPLAMSGVVSLDKRG